MSRFAARHTATAWRDGSQGPRRVVLGRAHRRALQWAPSATWHLSRGDKSLRPNVARSQSGRARAARGMSLASDASMSNTIEQLSAKAVGTVKAVKAGFNGLRGVFLHLAEEHGEVGAMMKQLRKTKDLETRRTRFAQVRAELLSHERAEIAEVYPALTHHDSTRELIVLHNQEAAQLENAIRSVDASDPGSDAWALAFERLFALVQQHVEEEEREFFPKAQAAIGEEKTEALLSRYEAAKNSAMQQL